MKPFKFIKGLFSKKNFDGLRNQLYNPNESDGRKACSAALGVFIGIIPIWGFQTLAAIFLSLVLKLNKVLVILFSQISFPVMFPLIIFLSYKAGGLWMGKDVDQIAFTSKLSFADISKHLVQYIYGSITLAVAAAFTFGLLTFFGLKLVTALKQKKVAAQKV